MSKRSIRRGRARAAQRRVKLGRGRSRTLLVGTGGAVGAGVIFAPVAEADTFTVTNLNDAGAGSLRQAITAANIRFGADQVLFQTGLSGTITLLTGDLNVVDESLEIVGPGAAQITVDGNANQRVFDLYSFSTPDQAVRISGLTLTDGNSVGGAVYQGGGGGFPPDLSLDGVTVTDSYSTNEGGGVLSRGGDLSIANSTVSGNEAALRGGGILKSGGPPATITNTMISGNDSAYQGGGVAATGGPLTITGSTISNNSSGYGGAGIYSDEGSLTIDASTVTGNDSARDGGGVNVEETAGVEPTEVIIRDSLLAGNTAGAAPNLSEGGGIYLDRNQAAALIERTTVRDNTAEEGGGIYVSEDVGAPVTIEAVTVSGNSATDEGGGIYIDAFSNAPVVVQNTTVSGNSAGQEGGGVAVDSDNNAINEAAIRNSTITGNTAAGAGGGIYRGSASLGGGVFSSDDLPLSSTIVADNSAPTDPDLTQSSEINSGNGAFLIGNSLIESAGGATITETSAGSNLLGTDPLLGPLADNGGPTQTHLPAPSSPVLDAGVANGLATDQRGEPRSFDASNLANGSGADGTDIGAVELSATGSCKGKAATVLFSPGQKITGAGQKDVVVGTESKDKVNTAGGKDTVCAGKGNDKVKGGGGKDKLLGQAGKDLLSGGSGKDKLKGGGGKDTLRGGPGRDKLSGGPGKDTERQ